MRYLLSLGLVLAVATGASAEPLDAGISDALVDAAVVYGPPLPPVGDAGVEEVVDAGVAETTVDAAPEEPEPPVQVAPHVESELGVRVASEPPTAPTAEEASDTTVFAIKVIGGLIALLALAYLGGHRRVVKFQEQLGIRGVIAAGFPFIALGMIAGLEPVGILTGEVLDTVRPVMLFGLGWLGFIIGAQLDIRMLERVPRGTAYLILVEAIGPFLAVTAGCGALMLGFGASIYDPEVWRDAILLGAAAAMTAPRKLRGFANRSWREGRGADVLLAHIDELVGVIGLLFITSYFRSDTASPWQMPDTAWVFVSLGVGVALGALIFAMVRAPTSNVEFFAVLLGGIAFASGFAGYLALSPIVVCFIAGVLVTNFPNEERDSVFKILRHVERPMHMMFLIVAGALWSVGDWRGWVLVPAFVAARLLGKWLGIIASTSVIGATMPDRFVEDRRIVAPMSALAIALVISVESSSRGQSIAWVVTAVIGGALVTELMLPAEQGEPTSDEDEP